MFPGPHDPDLGAFVAQGARELERRGHVIERAVIDRRGGSRRKYAQLARHAIAAARAFRPDVVYAHFLSPAGTVGALASLAATAPLVVTAHGRDVRNLSEVPAMRAITRLTLQRAAAVVAVSGYLRDELLAELPELEGRLEVIDSGVDLERFRGAGQGAARTALGWEGEGTAFLFVGTLDERKNVARLVEAFERLGSGRLAFVGDGPLRPQLEGRDRVRVVGRIQHAEVSRWTAACDVLCLPSTVEPFGQALLEAMASERSVVATRVGGPPEFVTRSAGALVDPSSVDSIEAGLRMASALPRPNTAARAAAAQHDVRLQAERIERVLERAAGWRAPAAGTPGGAADPRAQRPAPRHP